MNNQSAQKKQTGRPVSNPPGSDAWALLDEEFPSQSSLADVLGVSRQSVNIQRSKGLISPLWAVKVEKATKGRIKRSDLRPDIFL